MTKWDIVQSPAWVGFSNYIRMFTKDSVFKTGLKNVGILLVSVLLIQLPFALLLALLLSRLTKGVRLFKTAFFIPVTFSATAVGLVWLRMYDSTYGIINDLFRFFGIDYQQMWLSKPNEVMWAICVPLIWSKVGYYLIILYAGIKAIPQDYFEAALLDGCNNIHASFYITLPLLRNVMSMCAVLCAIGAVKEYPLIFVMTSGGPFRASMTPAIQMYVKAFIDMDFGYGSALAVMLVVISLFVYGAIHLVFPVKDLQY